MARYIFITGGVVSSLARVSHRRPLARCCRRAATRCGCAARSLSQRRPGTNVALSAWRSVCDRRRRETTSILAYERFTGRPATARTTSRPAASIRKSSPRSGAATISAPPFKSSLRHQRDQRLHPRGQRRFDFVLWKSAGRFGDIEGLPFFEAIRQLGNEVPRNHAIYIHLTLMPSSLRPANSRPNRLSIRSRSCVRSAFRPIFFFAGTDREIPKRNGAS